MDAMFFAMPRNILLCVTLSITLRYSAVHFFNRNGRYVCRNVSQYFTQRYSANYVAILCGSFL